MKEEIIVEHNPKSPTSEVFRTLRTNVQFMTSNKGLKTLLITSTMPEEGKSSISGNLAATFAQAGKKVILVDADMRKGRQSLIFEVERTPGLSNYLAGLHEEEEKGITDYVRDTSIENLYLIPAGDIPPNPSELIASSKMADFITGLKEISDIVIIDGPPCLLVTDAVLLSRYVDSTLIVAKYKSTKMDQLQKVKKDIENVGGKVAGVVLNKMPLSGKKYENAYYYGSEEPKETKQKKE